MTKEKRSKKMYMTYGVSSIALLLASCGEAATPVDVPIDTRNILANEGAIETEQKEDLSKETDTLISNYNAFVSSTFPQLNGATLSYVATNDVDGTPFDFYLIEHEDGSVEPYAEVKDLTWVRMGGVSIETVETREDGFDLYRIQKVGFDDHFYLAESPANSKLASLELDDFRGMDKQSQRFLSNDLLYVPLTTSGDKNEFLMIDHVRDIESVGILQEEKDGTVYKDRTIATNVKADNLLAEGAKDEDALNYPLTVRADRVNGLTIYEETGTVFAYESPDVPAAMAALTEELSGQLAETVDDEGTIVYSPEEEVASATDAPEENGPILSSGMGGLMTGLLIGSMLSRGGTPFASAAGKYNAIPNNRAAVQEQERTRAANGQTFQKGQPVQSTNELREREQRLERERKAADERRKQEANRQQEQKRQQEANRQQEQKRQQEANRRQNEQRVNPNNSNRNNSISPNRSGGFGSGGRGGSHGG